MKKILFLFIAILISINASATKYYVATAANGGDNGNTGAIGSPWLTVDYAATQATTAGDTIYITAGTYNETARIELSVGVSIHGAGVTSIINSTYTSGTGLPNSTDGAIYLSSSSVTNGNQSISYIKLTGTNLTGWYAFFSENRNNVKVHHCTIEDFRDRGVTFHNPTWTTGIYATGNEIHDCIIKNSSDRGSGCGGNIQIHGQDGIKIYNNTLSVIDRAAGDNGQILSAISGWNKGVKYYNNVSTTLESNGTEWNFHLETWDSKGGWEIYDNEFHGGGCYIDLGGSSNVRGAYEYSFYIHDNLFARAATQAYNASRESVGIAIEGATSDVIVTRNYFKYCQFGVTISVAQASKTTERIYINYNILENVGVTNNDWGGPFQIRLSAISDVVDDIYYENNVMTASASAASGVYAGLLCMQDGDAGQSFTDIYFRNNIVQGFLEGPIAIYLNGTVVTSLTNTHNVCYNNGNNNDIYYYGTATVTNYTVNNIIKSDPLFIGGSPYSYKLQETSPARDAGLSVGLTSDYGGYSVPVGALPDIGAWEYGADITPPNWTPQGIGWDRMYQKLNFRDSINFTRGFMIAGVPISASGSGLEILGGLTASVNDLNNTSGSTGNLQGQINSIVASTVDDSKADTSLSNLASVAINTHLLPDTAGTINLGSGAKPFGKIFGGSTIVSDLSIGDSTSNTIAKFDSVAVFNGKLYAFIAGDTVGWGILTADSEDITDHVIMLTDTTHTNGKHILYTQWQVDSIFAGFTSGFDSVYIYAKVDSLINVVGKQQAQIDLLWAAIDSLGLGDFNPPSFLSAEVGTFNDSILVVILNDTDVQQDSIPAVGAFTVKENRVAMGIEEIDIGNDTVYISLDTLAIEGYTYTVSYNKDFDYPQLQDSSENITPSWTNRTVTNNVFDAFPSIVSVTETLTNNSDRTSHPITMPEEVDEGDLLLVFFGNDGSGVPSIDTENSDTGWTLEESELYGSSVASAVLWKIADSDGDTLTITTSSAQISAAQTYRITDFDSADPVKVTKAEGIGPAAPDPPSNIGDYGADDYLWFAVCIGDGYTSYASAAPTDFTGLETTYVEIGGACSVSAAYRMYKIGTAYDPGTFTITTTDEEWVVYTVIINPVQ